MEAHTTPGKIDATVAKFIEELGAAKAAGFIAVSAPAWARHGCCVYNVLSLVETTGGQAVSGWTIWYTPGSLIEAEWHVVWDDGTGKLLDVTPKPDGETRILFIPDGKSVEWELSSFTPSKRKAFSLVAALSVIQGNSRDEAMMREWEAYRPFREANRAAIRAGAGARQKD